VSIFGRAQSTLTPTNVDIISQGRLLQRRVHRLRGRAESSADSAAFGNIQTWDPLASTLNQLATNDVTAGTLASAPDLNGIYDLRELNKVLLAAGKPTVSAAALGQE